MDNVDEMIEDLYLAGITEDDGSRVEITVTEISKELSVPLDKVRKVVFGVDELGTDPDCAYRKKQLIGNVIPVKSFVKFKGHIFLKSQATAMTALQAGLQKIVDKKADLTIAEVKDLSIIVGNIDKMHRLESGMPTDIIKNMNLKPDRIIQIIKSDPMYGGVKDEQEEKGNLPRCRDDSGSGGGESAGEGDSKGDTNTTDVSKSTDGEDGE